MEITEVKVFLVNEEKLKAFVSVVIDQCFMINDIKVIQGRDGLFISMPSRRKKNGEFKDVAHPLNNETRRWMESRILSEYGQLREQRDGESQVSASPRPQPPEDRVSPPPPAAVEPAAPEPSEAPEKSMEEVQQQHLNDSFWTVT